MNICPRCDRGHRGLCGIPGVTLGFGARIGGLGAGSSRAAETQRIGSYRPDAPKRHMAVLEALLAERKNQLAKVTEKLRVLPYEIPEYAALLDRESKLTRLVSQLVGQIQAR